MFYLFCGFVTVTKNGIFLKNNLKKRMDYLWLCYGDAHAFFKDYLEFANEKIVLKLITNKKKKSKRCVFSEKDRFC